MTYRLEADPDKRPAAGNYRYCVYRGDTLVARYWHDFRGDDHAVEFPDGTTEIAPLGRVGNFLRGGVGSPLTLTPAAVALLDRRTP